MSNRDERRAAFERLFAAHYWAVRAYVLRRGPASAADDVVAETFVVAWRRLDSLSDDPLPWLLGVARRILANHHRAERRRGALVTRLLSSGSDHEIGWEPPAEMSAEMGRAMAALSPREREALLLIAWDGLDTGRAARAAGCTAAAFRVRLHRARRRVAALLDDGPPRDTHRNSPIAEEAR
jgi:RNA polymerase sigma-70 factor (ECF subfamily)